MMNELLYAFGGAGIFSFGLEGGNTTLSGGTYYYATGWSQWGWSARGSAVSL